MHRQIPPPRPGDDFRIRTAGERDLVAGSGIEFETRGAHALKGVPGEWTLHRALVPVED